MSTLYPWQQQDWQRLQALRNRPPHGLLLKGAQGIGKLELAINFAQSLLCQHPAEHGLACGQCPACHWFAQSVHPDFRLVQPDNLSADNEDSESSKKASKQISVDQIRSLGDFVSMSSAQGGLRIVIIQPAETMNINAANALLKSLEEPPPGLIFILVTDKSQQLLPTILSRCLTIAVSQPDIATACAWLSAQGITQPQQALAASGFAPLQAAQTQLDNEARQALLQALRRPDHLDIFRATEALQKVEQVLIVQWMQQWCYDMLAMKLAGSVRYHPGEESLIKNIVASVPALNLARLQKYLYSAKREARHTLNAKLFLESLFLTYRQLLN